jgi:hypothetical protein
VSEDTARTFFNTYFPTLGTILNTFIMINNHLAIYQIDRFCRADFNAQPAGDTSRAAYFLGLFPGIPATARDKHPDVSRNEFDNFLRAGSDTGPTAHTRRRIDHGKIIHHGDGMEGTDISALPKAYAGILTLFRPAEGKTDTGT